MINRKLYQIIQEKMFAGKAIIILGARQTGKSTLLRQIQQQTSETTRFLDCDDPQIRKLLEGQSTPNLSRLVADTRVVFIDEAQRVTNIGLSLKQIHDNNPEIQLIVSGSSSFDLVNEINEPMTGRKWEYQFFPLSFGELTEHFSLLDEMRLLETRLVYGSYPDVVNNPGNEKEILKNLTSSYLYKDIFDIKELRKPRLLDNLLQQLAFQTASEVSFNELANALQVNIATVEKYIYLLEQAFIIFRLPSFSRNIRNELKKSRKIYFYDNGVRNMIVSNFNSVNLRNDVGQLWENYLIAERFKHIAYNNMYCNRYFWRTTQQQEIDYIEEHSGKIYAYEMKWNPNKKSRLSKTFANAYPNHEFQVINRDNYMSFIS